MSSKDFWKWQYYVCRKWQPPGGFSKVRIVGFAVTLASWGSDGKGIRPSANTLIKATGLSRSTVVEMRQMVVNFGLFRETGRTANKIPILEIQIPPDLAEPEQSLADTFGRTCEHAGKPAYHSGCPDCDAATARITAQANA